ncbi:hypothetical protein CANARDRAFT_26966 [[Candida] arabinofermentans NRRL YB-2248]|uniref:Uncharacterized protein n=1 Tax=[Candida] arabinofermentans NRRL YB-2248 TaxID=983967 RepID=A0A1E4T767_9ASCO|nr:hypothetical protein CANARDRAFT_26966 [[Candida] arabinofermentans NRRL YB-2248]
MVENSVLPVHGKESEKISELKVTSGDYEDYNPIRERFSYAIACQLFLVYLIFLYYEHINLVHPLLAGLLLGGQSSCMAQSLNQYYHKTYSFNKHVKFYIWGTLNGLFTTVWIHILFTYVEHPMYRFLVDQSIGTGLFQFMFVLFNCVWERADLITQLKTTYVSALKYSYMIWPAISFLSFNYLTPEVIFPLNCFCNLIFTFVLAILT